MLNRGLCVYKSLNLTGVAKKDRSAALAIHLRQMSPFAHPGHFITFHGDIAQIWLWDAVVQRRASRSLHALGASPIPESLLQKKPPGDGLFLRTCLSGYELQYWQNDALIHSKWWPHRPSEEEIHLFATASDSIENEAKHFVPGPWLDKPWGSALRIGTPNLTRFEHFIVPALLCITTFFIMHYAIQGLLLRRQIQKIEQEQQALERSIQPVLEARAAMAEDTAAIEAITALTPAPPLTTVFAEAVRLLQPNRLEMVGWQYQYPTLLLHLRGPRPSEPSLLVKSFETNALFSAVSFAEDPGNKTLTLTMTLNQLEEGQRLVEP